MKWYVEVGTTVNMPLPNPNRMQSVGVIYLPFQTHTLAAKHLDLIEAVVENHTTVIIALPVKKIRPSKNSPLNFREREEMIREELPHHKALYIVPVPERKYPTDRIAALHTAVTAPFDMVGDVTLYTDPEFREFYRATATNSKWTLSLYKDLEDILEVEKVLRADLIMNPYYSSNNGSEMYRRGLIVALNRQFPINWPTVDIAIKRVVGDKTFYLLGKKPGENHWRFPGGFKDRGDQCFEVSVIREASEEVMEDSVLAASGVFTDPKYITSRNVNDWRYRGEIDGITTSFYEIEFVGTDDQLRASDDLAQIKWFDLSELSKDDMEGEHVFLLDALKESKRA